MKYYFGDNREYGAADIKKAFGVFAAQGGIDLGLSDGKQHSPSDLNRIIAAAVSKGVVTESNSCLRLDEKDGGYYILPGKGVFSDGGMAEVEEETRVNISGGHYLYIAYSEMLDEVYFLVTSDPRADSVSELLIPIAYVDESGKPRDMREFARGKLPALPSATWNVLREVELVVDASTVTHGEINSDRYIEARHPIDGDINFMMVESEIFMSTMKIGPDGAAYHTVAGGGTGLHIHTHDYFGVHYSGSFYRATYLGGGSGYIDLRYYFPKNLAGGRFSYKATVGIKNNPV